MTYYFLIASVLLLAAIFSSKVSEKFGIPALVLFLGIGMVAGSDGPGGIFFTNTPLAKLVGSLALVYILFSGALETDFKNIRPVMYRGIVLSTVGVFITAAMVAFFTYQFLGFTIEESMMLGAIVSSTDAAAVFAVLRSKNMGLSGNLRPLLELESGSNDPMAIFLTMSLIAFFGEAHSSAGSMLMQFVISMSVGAAFGIGLGRLAARLLNNVKLDYEGLYPVLSLAIALLVYSLTEVARGNGFLAVYLCGLVLGSSDFPYKRSLTRFHNGLAWLMQIMMFIILGLLVFPSQLPSVTSYGLILSIFMIIIARPTAVYLCLVRSEFSFREKTLVAWAGLRGAVPIVLATFPLMAGYPGSDRIFNIVFFIVLTSVMIQGRMLLPVARWLKVHQTLKAAPRYPLEFDRTDNSDTQTREYEILPGTATVGKTISQMELPKDSLVLLIRREKQFVVPRGNTKLEPFDTLMVMAKTDDLAKVWEIVRASAPAIAEDQN